MPLGTEPLRVLLVEDNLADADLIREALDEALEALGGTPVEVLHARRLSDAEGLLAGGVSVVLLDLSLPDSQGLASFTRIRARAPDVPVVVLSGLQDEAMAVRAVREGAQDYLVKGQADGLVLLRSLRHAIARAHAEAERARLLREQTEAAAALRARDEVLASISHDLKNPLASIKANAQLLQRRLQAEQPLERAAVAERLGHIARAATQMARLLDDLVDATRFEAGRELALQLGPTDLRELAAQLLTETRPAAERHELRLEAPDAPLVGLWDAARLERVLANLLANAIKYSPTGGPVEVRLRREDTPAGAWAVLEVHDEGLGIPPEDLPHIFERFYRGRNVAATIPGTGLGLFVARQIVAQHGGTITAASTPGQGTTFTVRLPLGVANAPGG
ncbi:MAG TPA: hybrid sensor histidine kinase/response regulator [Chloroflexota bacterium]|nr:hybrid sensor histidine kinase/response regulator [Chloroflexota bacterium]